MAKSQLGRPKPSTQSTIATKTLPSICIYIYIIGKLHIRERQNSVTRTGVLGESCHASHTNTIGIGQFSKINLNISNQALVIK